MTGIIFNNPPDPDVLAADDAFTSAYAPIAAVQTAIFVPASTFVVITGTPVIGEASTFNIGGYLFDAAGTETVWGTVQIPFGWATYNIDLWWVNAGAGSGNVVWRVDYSTGFGDAETSIPGTAGTSRTVAAPAGDVAEVTSMDTGLTVPTSGELLPLSVRRSGGDAADTLANDACLLGLRLTKAS